MLNGCRPFFETADERRWTQILSRQNHAFPFQLRAPEIKNESHRKVAYPQIVYDLRCLDLLDLIDALYFDDNPVKNNQVRNIIPHAIAFVKNIIGLLQSKRYGSQAEFNGKGSLIWFFKKAVAETIQDFHSAANDLVRFSA